MHTANLATRNVSTWKSCLASRFFVQLRFTNKEKPYKVGVGFFKVAVHLDIVLSVSTDLCDCDVKKIAVGEGLQNEKLNAAT